MAGRSNAKRKLEQQPVRRRTVGRLLDAPPQDIGRKRRNEEVIGLCDKLIDLSAAWFDVPSREIRESRRGGPGVTRTRQVAMYIAHVGLRLSMQEVGAGFQRDRTTVVYACHLIEDMRDDVAFDLELSRFERVVTTVFRDWTGARA